MATSIPFGSGDTGAQTIPFGGQSVANSNLAPKQSTSDQIWSHIASYVQNVANTVNQAGQNVNAAFTAPGQSGVEQGVNASGAAAGGVMSTAASLIPGGTTALNAVGQGFGAATNFAGGISDTLGNLASKIPGVSYNQNKADINGANFANSSTGKGIERVANVGNSLGNVSNVILGAKGLADTGNAVAQSTSDISSTLKGIQYVKNQIAPPETATPQVDTQGIVDTYTRAIKPSVAGKATASQLAAANSKIVTGLQAIADNKGNLSFTGPDGETIVGAAPKTVDQLSQSIGQTKSTIFKQYDALAKQAGENGVIVDGTKVGAELQPVIDSKSLAIANPQAVEYAKTVQDRFNQAGGIDAQTAQDVIQHYNDSLKAFYRNPSYDTASQASIDALIANKMREQLDAGISDATGEQYGELKSQYGALSSMEKDVARRAQVWARQNNVGFAGNLTNIASGAELVRGLVTLNPADLAVSGVIKGIQKYAEYLNNPDVGVAKIFSRLTSQSPSATAISSAPVAGGTGIGKP